MKKTCEMYPYVSILFCSHISGLSSEKKIQVFGDCGSKVSLVEKIRCILEHIIAYPVTGIVNGEVFKWKYQRDNTMLLSEFDAFAFRETFTM